MTCDSCVNSIKAVSKTTSGVISVDVSLEDEQVRVEYDMTRITENQIVEVIENCGYDVTTTPVTTSSTSSTMPSTPTTSIQDKSELISFNDISSPRNPKNHDATTLASVETHVFEPDKLCVSKLSVHGM